MPMVYSSLQAFDELVASGIPEHQARAIVQTPERSTADLATKADLDQLRADMEKLFWRAMAIQTGIGITIAAAAVAIAEAL